MNEKVINEAQIHERSFQQIHQKRISEIEEKVSKYCSQYDALMNLLPIGNQFFALANFQKQIQTIDPKIDLLNSRINDINNGQLPVERSFWEKQIQNLNSLHAENQKEIAKIQKSLNQKNKITEDLDFEQKLAQMLKSYEERVTLKLAYYKNKIQKERHNQSKSGYKRVYESIRQKIQNHLQPYHKQLDILLSEIQISRLKVPFRDLRNFHDFNYKRLQEQIINLNQTLEGYFKALSNPIENQYKIDAAQINQIHTQIESIMYQAIGNRQKCLSDMLVYYNYGTSSENSWEEMEGHINDCYYELNESLKEIRERTDLLLRFVAQN